MPQPRNVTPAALASRVARAAARPGALCTLLLDLDGTLAPIAPTPEAARIPPATQTTLGRLAGSGWTLAVLSGRPLREVRRMLPLRKVLGFGCHGLQGAWPGAKALAVPGSAGDRIARLHREGRELAGRFPGVRLERKPYGLAFHDRGLPAKATASWRRSLDAWLGERDLTGLETLRGKRVLELRPRGAHKGAVVRRMPGLRRATGDASLVAIGDDRTDEDMFAAVAGRGLSVRVGRPGVPSCADLRLASPVAVARFLSELAETVDPRR